MNTVIFLDLCVFLDFDVMPGFLSTPYTHHTAWQDIPYKTRT